VGDSSCEVILGSHHHELTNRLSQISNGKESEREGDDSTHSWSKLQSSRSTSFVKTEEHLVKLKYAVTSRQEQHRHGDDTTFKKHSSSKGHQVHSLDDVNLLVKASKLTPFEQLVIRFVGWWLQVKSLEELQRIVYGESDEDGHDLV